VYYVSKSLQEAEVKYLSLEKAILAIIHATKKLPYYFQAHTVIVLTQLPLQALLRKSDYTGRIAKWGTMLGAFDIKYLPRTTIKGQVLADLIAEFTEELGDSKEGTKLEETLRVNSVESQQVWQLFVDSLANQRGSGKGIVMISPDGITLEKSLRLGFLATNNKAKYEALLAGITTMQKLGGRVVRAYCDSRLIVGQVWGDFEAKDPRMI